MSNNINTENFMHKESRGITEYFFRDFRRIVDFFNVLIKEGTVYDKLRIVPQMRNITLLSSLQTRVDVTESLRNFARIASTSR